MLRENVFHLLRSYIRKKHTKWSCFWFHWRYSLSLIWSTLMVRLDLDMNAQKLTMIEILLQSQSATARSSVDHAELISRDSTSTQLKGNASVSFTVDAVRTGTISIRKMIARRFASQQTYSLPMWMKLPRLTSRIHRRILLRLSRHFRNFPFFRREVLLSVCVIFIQCAVQCNLWLIKTNMIGSLSNDSQLFRGWSIVGGRFSELFQAYFQGLLERSDLVHICGIFWWYSESIWSPK